MAHWRINEKQPTYLHPPTGNYYAIDLSLCHPSPVPPGEVEIGGCFALVAGG